jgi:O-acetyl-ADP-ribose deacetylase
MIEVIFGDITKINVDAIVNAANSSLLGGSGVDGAIHKNGGIQILEECQQIRNKQGGCKVGEAVITTAGKLPSKYVIHTVGPVWNGGHKNENELLASCYINSLNLARLYEVKSLAFPNISTGIYKFPKANAARIAFNVINAFHLDSFEINKIIFCCYDIENYKIYKSFLDS